ncbi:hypothetical protein CWI38_0217p0010 [Hamiltosporidium tvaerminnensis]|uniref:Leucine-rich repeat-containing protein n=2 Tax=Hamiltosporidium TaxID=1176354 RepID=A0A4V6MVP2_9MICR|nr:hypothetical protein CWI38_0217p0010 [Hamiltosporidium tvaerminnensis]
MEKNEKNEEEEADEEFEEDYEIKILHGYENNYYDISKPFFIYSKENLVNFEVLDSILSLNMSENKPKEGIIECRYQLSYFLRLTRDVTEVTNNLNIQQFKYILMTLKFLKAVENKNITKLLQVLIFNNFFYQKDYKLRNYNLHLIQILNSSFFTQIDFHLKRNIMSSFLNSLMIRYDFYDENLIIFKNSKELFDYSMFSEHIPYKNLMINNFDAFCSVENILRDSNVLIIFQILLKEINIKSLILNNFFRHLDPDENFAFLISKIEIFKAFTISNYKIPASPFFLFCLIVSINNNIEYLRLENISYCRLNLRGLLEGKKLKGLILSKIGLTENASLINESRNVYETIEYIDIQGVFLNHSIWHEIFQYTNSSKIILHFNNSDIEEIFINNLKKFEIQKNSVLYLEIKFNSSTLPRGFCNSLIHFKNLKTLKLDGYIIYEDTESLLYKAIYYMKELECLVLCQNCRNTKPYIFLLQNSKIDCLDIQSTSNNNDAIMIEFFRLHKSMTRISIKDAKVSSLCLKEIFKQKNLIHLCLDIDILPPQVDQESLTFKSKNIHNLDLCNNTLKYIEGVDILSKLYRVHTLRISKCNPPPGYLSKLNKKCNSYVKILTYEYGILDFDDLNRIGKLGNLLKLNLLGCKFSGCSFFDLVTSCKFFKSLKTINLLNSNIKMKDFQCMKRFKKLKRAVFSFTEFNLLTLKNSLASLQICKLKFHTMLEDSNYNEFCLYLNESNIYILRG